jgi:hypothetical protein
MKVRLHEIEVGSNDVEKTTAFYQTIFLFQPAIRQEGLTVFDAGLKRLDFNLSSHLPQGIVAISFLTDDLSEIERRLKDAGIAYEGPSSSHLGMTCIEFRSPDGYVIKVNTPGPASPEWLKV